AWVQQPAEPITPAPSVHDTLRSIEASTAQWAALDGVRPMDASPATAAGATVATVVGTVAAAGSAAAAASMASTASTASTGSIASIASIASTTSTTSTAVPAGVVQDVRQFAPHDAGRPDAHEAASAYDDNAPIVLDAFMPAEP
ncbi:hypothetical protein SB778_35305, partial [Paraburkholderia sp. SIMBA_050]